MFDETSKLKDLYDNVIHVVISAMEGINGKTFPPVSVMKSLVKCWVLTVFPPPLCSYRNCVCVWADVQWEDTHNVREWT